VLAFADDLAVPVVAVVADAHRIAQALTNYLTNALKYAPADQPIVVTSKSLDHRALHQPAQTVAGAGDSLRETRGQLPRDGRSRLYCHLARRLSRQTDPSASQLN